MKNRIWELDAARGLCVIGMVAVHLLYDLDSIFGWISLSENPVFQLFAHWGGVLFFLISGICVTLGSHPVRRGICVLLCGVGVSAAMWIAVQLQFFGSAMLIWFGVLHCLGVCMLLWPAVRRLPVWALSALALGIIVAGFGMMHLRADHLWLMPLGLTTPDFATSDYFPLLPFWGFFLLGAVLGKTVYKERRSLLPKVSAAHPIVRTLSFFGKWSLPIYLLHQPLIFVVITAIT